MSERRCVVCSIEIKDRHPVATTCGSQQCSREVAVRRSRRFRLRHPSTTYKTCIVCGSLWAPKTRTKVCSEECKMVHAKKIQQLKRVPKECIVCKNIFYRAANWSTEIGIGRIRGATALTCNEVCHYINMRKLKRHTNQKDAIIYEVYRTEIERKTKETEKSSRHKEYYAKYNERRRLERKQYRLDNLEKCREECRKNGRLRRIKVAALKGLMKGNQNVST